MSNQTSFIFREIDVLFDKITDQKKFSNSEIIKLKLYKKVIEDTADYYNKFEQIEFFKQYIKQCSNTYRELASVLTPEQLKKVNEYLEVRYEITRCRYQYLYLNGLIGLDELKDEFNLY